MSVSAAQEPGSYFDVLGVPVSTLTMEIACQRIEDWAVDKVGRFVCIREVASLMAIRDNPQTEPLHKDAAMVTPDGMPLVFLGKLKGLPVERVCGPDLIDEMMARSARTGLRHYFYGGKEGVAETMARGFMQRYPGARVVGWECPPFRQLSEAEEAEVLARIDASGADVVWVGLSSPKQDMWMWRNYQKMSQTLIGVGAAFDFHTGAVKRAPRWMQRSGLEWAFRLSQEPRRLYKRYLVLAPRFVALVMAKSLAKKT